jgi:hypothetical protein
MEDKIKIGEHKTDFGFCSAIAHDRFTLAQKLDFYNQLKEELKLVSWNKGGVKNYFLDVEIINNKKISESAAHITAYIIRDCLADLGIIASNKDEYDENIDYRTRKKTKETKTVITLYELK